MGEQLRIVELRRVAQTNEGSFEIYEPLVSTGIGDHFKNIAKLGYVRHGVAIIGFRDSTRKPSARHEIWIVSIEDAKEQDRSLPTFHQDRLKNRPRPVGIEPPLLKRFLLARNTLR